MTVQHRGEIICISFFLLSVFHFTASFQFVWVTDTDTDTDHFIVLTDTDKDTGVSAHP